DVLVEVDSPSVGFDAFARPGWRLAARVVDLAIDLIEPVPLRACERGGVDREGDAAAAPVRRQRDRRPVLGGQLAAAVELVRDQAGEREGPMVDLGVACPDL